MDPRTKDICIFATCFNSNFTRSFYGHLGDSPLPIALGESEYGQYGHSDRRNPYGGVFFSDVLQLKRNVSVREFPRVNFRRFLINFCAARRAKLLKGVQDLDFIWPRRSSKLTTAQSVLLQKDSIREAFLAFIFRSNPKFTPVI
jgi:hypothetical protein